MDAQKKDLDFIVIVTAANEYGIRNKVDKKTTLSLNILYCLTQISGFVTLSNLTQYLNLICGNYRYRCVYAQVHLHFKLLNGKISR